MKDDEHGDYYYDESLSARAYGAAEERAKIVAWLYKKLNAPALPAKSHGQRAFEACEPDDDMPLASWEELSDRSKVEWQRIAAAARMAPGLRRRR
jgi:hypothetical protein